MCKIQIANKTMAKRLKTIWHCMLEKTLSKFHMLTYLVMNLQFLSSQNYIMSIRRWLGHKFMSRYDDSRYPFHYESQSDCTTKICLTIIMRCFKIYKHY